jgi:hypothetical protein
VEGITALRLKQGRKKGDIKKWTQEENKGEINEK